MKLSAPAAQFASLYDGTPKLIAVGACAGLEAGAMPLRLLRLVRHDGGYLLLSEGAGAAEGEALRPLAIPPAAVQALWSCDEAARRDAERLLDWWEEAGGQGSAPPQATGDASTVLHGLLTQALAEIDGLHRRNAGLQRTLSTLREEWGRSVRLPPEAVELLDALRLSPPRLVFATPRPVGALAVPLRHGRNPAGAAEIVQRLPAGARGLAGLDLHLDQAPRGSGVLAVVLTGVETGETIAEWALSFGDLRSGWLPLRLPTASTRMDRLLDLRIGATGVVTEAPRLSLAQAGLLDEYAVAPPARAVGQPAMLALRLWGGLPGLEYGPAAHLASRPAPDRMVWPLNEPVLSQLRKGRDFEATFPWFGLLRGGRVLLHPLHGVVTAALIPLDEVPGAVAVRARAVIDDPRCRAPIACKLVAAPPSVTVDEAEREEGVLASSGWMVLEEPRRPLDLTAVLAAPWSGPMALHLFTDIPDRGHALYGRTIFSDFEVEIDSQTAWAHPPALPVSEEIAATP
ncbi:DUF6212 domain-containing protein [Azospirillum brasilense]|uniref:DUF6212 domain-containing protein n=1 Tax=Azospirillum brasilense TaxID=192 RepID=UPI000E686668|nr:DUF6212 domain-containing protein [Azospirillum brasilense]NUB27049.1 hypothetical protein [Azospirillum brasilense]NUB34820.1 hypothetical protein [Azospirillum brasilense]RIV99513.1 hypothetical protein D2T81_23250 [Azospirillum brasilense]